MFRYRLIYSITLFAAFIFYLTYSPWFSWYLLVLVIALAPLDLLVSLPGMRSRSAVLAAPRVLNKGAIGVLTVRTVCKGGSVGIGGSGAARSGTGGGWAFPLRCLYAKLLVTEDNHTSSLKLLCPADISGTAEVAIDTSACGLAVFSVRRLYAVSLLGLFSKRIAAPGKASVLILPPAKKPEGSIALPRHLILRPKPGGGFSEEHEIRGYLPGDPVKGIHWKLSAKFDSLMIREPLVPLKMSRLVHIMPWEDDVQRESALAHLLWVSDELLGKGLTFYIKLDANAFIAEVSSKDDLVEFLRKGLDGECNGAALANMPRVTRFAWVYTIISEKIKYQ